MWVIKNKTTGQFFAGRSESGEMLTSDSKIYASHFSTWDAAATEIKHLVGAWEVVPKDKA